jgi:hypothetical protein
VTLYLLLLKVAPEVRKELAANRLPPDFTMFDPDRKVFAVVELKHQCKDRS